MSTIQVPPAVNRVMESGKNYAKENPMMTLTVVAVALTCAIPILIFLSFAVATLLITFIGFLFVEGM